MANNQLYIPHLNPVKFFKVNQSNLAAYFTKHFDYYDFEERLYEWQDREDYTRVWQTTDIINLQFESTFDPIIVQLLDSKGNIVIALPALVGLPNRAIPNAFSFEVQMSLATVPTGCYRIKIIAGPTGLSQQIYLSGKLYISEDQLKNTLLLEYWHNKFFNDVIFETGIKFQFRVHGHFGFLIPGSSQERYNDEKFNPSILSSKNFRQWSLIFGDEYGLPDDIIDLLSLAWSCNNMSVDGKLFAAVDNKMDFVEVKKYPKRGVKITVQEGINRNSTVFDVDVDPNKQLISTVLVDAKVFGDTSNQGSSNAVPVLNIE